MMMTDPLIDVLILILVIVDNQWNDTSIDEGKLEEAWNIDIKAMKA